MFSSYVEKVAQNIFGSSADAARPYIRGFLDEREEARRVLPAESSDNQWQAACVNWAIRQFVIMERRVAEAHKRLDGAMDQRDGYRAKVDKVDAAMERLLDRLGLVANVEDITGHLTVEPKAKPRLAAAAKAPKKRKTVTKKKARRKSK